MSESRRRNKLISTFKWVAKLVLSVSVFAALGYIVGWKQVWETLTSARLDMVILAWLVSLASRAWEATLMAMIMREGGMTISAPRVFLANSLSAFYGMFLPGDLLASGAKWVDLSFATGKKSAVFNAIVYNRLMVLAPWFIAGLIAFGWHNPWEADWLVPLLILVGILGGTVFASLYSPRLGQKLDRFVLRMTDRTLPHRLSNGFSHVLMSLDSFRDISRVRHLSFLAHSFGIAMTKLLIWAFMAASLDINLRWFVLVWVVSAIIALRQLPLSIHGIGVREGFLVVALRPFGFAADLAFSLGLLVFTNLVLFAIIGAIYQVVLLTKGAKRVVVVGEHFLGETDSASETDQKRS